MTSTAATLSVQKTESSHLSPSIWQNIARHILGLLDGTVPLICRKNLGFLAGFFLIGMALTWEGHCTWDTVYHLSYGKWLVGKYIGKNKYLPFEMIKLYGPLWEYPMVFMMELFGFLKDPTWIRHATTFTLFPVTLILVCRVIVQSGEKLSTGLLASALLFGLIRFGGHSVLNIKDFPFACGYLLATLYLYRLLNDRVCEPRNFAANTKTLALITMVSISTYLLRAPVIHHFGGLVLMGVFIALFESQGLPKHQRLVAALFPVTFGLLAIWCVWPTLWEAGFVGWLKSFGLFSKFTWTGKVRFFGTMVDSTELPLWYAPSWILVSYEPVAFATVVLGTVLFLTKLLPAELRRFNLLSTKILFNSLPTWLALFALAPWIGFVVLRPVFYDEERHLLFALVPLAPVAALGLRNLPTRLQVLLAGIITTSSFFAYAQFGKLSYVYKSPLIEDRTSENFMGDYWGVSVGKGVAKLYELVPDKATVRIIGPLEAVNIELRRLTDNFLRRRLPAKTFEIGDKKTTATPLYVLAINRNGINSPMLLDVEQGKAQLLWQEKLPFDTPHIVLVRYDQPCDYCHMGEM